MNKGKIPVLCGGTFFALLLEAAKQGRNERKKWGAGSEFTESDILDALFCVAVPTFERTADKENFKSVVSAYKSCNVRKSGRLPIHGQATVATFDSSVKSDYQTSLLAMNGLVDQYIDVEGKGLWLVRALLDLLIKDENIESSTLIYACQNGQPIAKSALCRSSHICIPSLLLGLWHFVVVNNVDNASGKNTYDEWCPAGESPNTRESFRSSIGDGITQMITICPLSISGTTDPIDDEPFSDYSESYEMPPPPEAASQNMTQTINSPAVFFNIGANGMQINNTGVLNIDRSSKV